MKFYSIFFILLTIQTYIFGQNLVIDQLISPSLRILRQWWFDVQPKTGDLPERHKLLKKMGKIQKEVPESQHFFCDTVNGRSKTPPNSVHKLRPGDIDIIAAIGDSQTAGNGIMSSGWLLDVFWENRGLSVLGGGKGNWRTFLTLPNIFKEFNPKLYGYSEKDGMTFHKSSRFVVAEPVGASEDMPYQCSNLAKRMRSNPKVDMKHHWKLINIFMGLNDFCSFLCTKSSYEIGIKAHENDLVNALRIIRDQIPRSVVNIILPTNPGYIFKNNNSHPVCRPTHSYLVCTCFNLQGKKRDMYINAVDRWNQMDFEVSNREEFQNSSTFTVNVLTAMMNATFFKTKDGSTDLRYISGDCIHFSPKGNAAVSNALWNNMLEPTSERSYGLKKEFTYFKCPTKARPYLFTNVNSKWIK